MGLSGTEFSVQQTLFKPDSKYKSLIVSKHPQTFKKGVNFSSYLDECIRDYILSPFDENSSEMLSRLINQKQQKTHIGAKTNEDDIIRAVMKSTKMERCTQYIVKYGVYHEDENKNEIIDLIRKDYKEFVKEFCRIMIENKRLLLEIQQLYVKKVIGDYFES